MHVPQKKVKRFQKTWGWLNDDRHFWANYPFKRKHWQKYKTEIAEPLKNSFWKNPRSMFNCAHFQSTALTEARPKKTRPIWCACEETEYNSEKTPEIMGRGKNTARVNKTSSHTSSNTAENLISIEARCHADRKKSRGDWSDPLSLKAERQISSELWSLQCSMGQPLEPELQTEGEILKAYRQL